MSVVKVVLRKKLKADGTLPLTLRITKDRKSSYVYLGYHIFEADWDALKQRVRKTHPNSTRMNNFIIKKLSEATDKALELETNHPIVSNATMAKRIKPNSGGSFIKQAEVYLNTLKEAGKFNEYTADKPRINHFKEFLNGSDISFPDITPGLLERFQHYLKLNCKVGKTDKPIGQRTIVNHLVVIRSVFSQAIKQGATEKKYYPFGKEGISIKFPETAKVGLSSEEVKLIEEVELTNSNHNHARNLWLVSFYFGGMRISDVFRLKWSDFKDNRLHYTMAKNNKTGSLKVIDRVNLILAQYQVDKRYPQDFIFPELKKLEDFSDEFLLKRIISENASRVDKFLRKFVAPMAGVTHKMTMHIARHTFGNIAGNNKVSLIMLQKLFRHSRITTTMAYMSNFIHKDTDEALDSVVGN